MNAILMSIVGFFIGGAANMISATITADLGRQGPIQGNKEGLATVTGIVDGTGSIGAALGQLLVPLIQKEFNWFFVFYFFILLVRDSVISIFLLFLNLKLTPQYLVLYLVRVDQHVRGAAICSWGSRTLGFLSPSTRPSLQLLKDRLRRRRQLASLQIHETKKAFHYIFDVFYLFLFSSLNVFGKDVVSLLS